MSYGSIRPAGSEKPHLPRRYRGFGSRAEAPGKYESYVDLEPGVWTKYRLEIAGRTARLFVHGAVQPCLIVNDLRLDPSPGAVVLWVGPGTEGYFANLKITPSSVR